MPALMPDIETIYLIHHSHTDIGYTHDQPIVWELQNRVLLEAIELAEKYAASDDDSAFRWTVEVTAVLEHWLARASSRDIERLIAMERAGRIEITGLFVNATPLFDIDQWVESLLLVRRLRDDYGFDIRSAMNCDVNGASWALVDLLLDAGFDGFTMAINPHFGGAMKPRPWPFRWQGASGRLLPTFNGWPYNQGWELGIGRDANALAATWWPRAQAYLHEIEYPLPILLIQTFHPFGDNGTAFDYSPFIAQWNASGRKPRIIMATPRQWWAALQPYLEDLPVLRGDWTDFWSFGTISSAREEAIARATRARLRTADALFAVGQALGFIHDNGGHWLKSSLAWRETAWRSLHLWAEHSWGADDSVWFFDSEDSASGWVHKAQYVYQARSLSLMMQRDGVAELARRVSAVRPDDLLVFNPLPWERVVSGAVRRAIAQPRGAVDDQLSSRHFLDRKQELRVTPEGLDALSPEVPRLLIPPTRVPAFGYAVLEREKLCIERSILEVSEAETVENAYFRLRFDRERGGISSLYDKRLDWEWVDPAVGSALHTIVHERVADMTTSTPRKRLFDHVWPLDLIEIPSGWKRGWWARRSCGKVVRHQVFQTPLGWSIIQYLQVDGIEGEVRQRVFLPEAEPHLECESSWHMGLTTHPESVYVLFPFNLPNAVARYDLGGLSVQPGLEQLPGVCRDYFAAQGYVDFSDDVRGITVTLPENPLFQLGDFHFGDYQMTFELKRPLLLSWVTSNYWETNFRAHQPGLVHARYRLHPHAGGFDEGMAYRWGVEALYDEPLLQHFGEPRAQGKRLPQSGTLLHLPEPPVAVLHLKPGDDPSERSLLVRLLNLSDRPQKAEIASGLIAIRAARYCDLLEGPGAAIPVNDGRLWLDLEPRRIVTVQLQVD